MKARPVNFIGDMVRAILEGRKTQTRRIVKASTLMNLVDATLSPLGGVGGQLWVRETSRVIDYRSNGDALVRYEADKAEQWVQMPSRIKYVPVGKCIPNGCHKEASRITLEITAVRVERLNDIKEHDAIREGLYQLPASGRYCLTPGAQYFGMASASSKEVFSWLWESIYGDESWKANPFVWVIEFKRVEVQR